MNIRRSWALSAMALISAILLTSAIHMNCAGKPSAKASRSVTETAGAVDRTPSEPPTPALPSTTADAVHPVDNTPISVLSLPPVGTRERRQEWVRAEYGDGNEQLGKNHPEPEGEIRPPQSFGVTRDGNLMVLDSHKKRLVFYDRSHRFERAVPIPSLVEPADVAVAADGTIVVQDHSGLQTRGMLMLDEAGTDVKTELPALQNGEDIGMYTAGTDVYFDSGLTSRKVASTSGEPGNETPEIYSDGNGVIPGHVAPDGTSVLSAGIDNFEKGEFFVNLVRGAKPNHIFTRFFAAGEPLDGLPFFQMDQKGNIYVVVDATANRYLLCLDGAGNPVGRVDLPRHQLTEEETPYRSFAVVPTGGILYRVLSDAASTWEWFDCH